MLVEDIQFTSEFKIEGVWWIPEYQDVQVNGNLSYSLKDGIVLKTSGHFKSNRIQNGDSKKSLESSREIIYGTLTSGLQVSLFNCYGGVDLIHFGTGQSSQKFYISTAFFGKHLRGQKVSQLSFQKMILYLKHLEDWLGVYPIIDDNIDSEMIKKKFDGLTLTYKYPSLPFFMIEQIGVKVEFPSAISVLGKGRYLVCPSYMDSC